MPNKWNPVNVLKAEERFTNAEFQSLFWREEISQVKNLCYTSRIVKYEEALTIMMVEKHFLHKRNSTILSA